jgi:hypothetical protein
MSRLFLCPAGLVNVAIPDFSFGDSEMMTSQPAPVAGIQSFAFKHRSRLLLLVGPAILALILQVLPLTSSWFAAGLGLGYRVFMLLVSMLVIQVGIALGIFAYVSVDGIRQRRLYHSTLHK